MQKSNHKPSIAAILVAAGTGSRLGGDAPKPYRLLAGRPLLRYALSALSAHTRIAFVQPVIHAAYAEDFENAAAGITFLPPVVGGETRGASVLAGLRALVPHAPDFVMIHDAARPFLSAQLLDKLCESASENKAIVPALAVADTVRRQDNSGWSEVPRAGLWRMQTPQLFPFDTVLALSEEAAKRGEDFTDDAALWLAAGLPLNTITGDEQLRKITVESDMQWASNHASRTQTRMATGLDVHRMIPSMSGSMRLGGIDIPSAFTLEGHSDADVVLHALVDAMLGSIAAGDIGQHFPPSDTQWKGADSAKFVSHACQLLAQAHAVLTFIDITILCEQPKIAPHRDAMRVRIAELCGIAMAQVSVKATTTEKLGFTGRGEGIAAQVSVSVEVPYAL